MGMSRPRSSSFSDENQVNSFPGRQATNAKSLLTAKKLFVTISYAADAEGGQRRMVSSGWSLTNSALVSHNSAALPVS